jgi:hypothetical protein
MGKLILLSLIFSIVACATPEERGASMAKHIERTFGPTCKEMGFQPDTDKYRECKLSLFNADTQRAGAAAAAAIKK